jgi:hypothetical protein
MSLRSRVARIVIEARRRDKVAVRRGAKTGRRSAWPSEIETLHRTLCVLAQLTHIAPEFQPGDDTIVR